MKKILTLIAIILCIHNSQAQLTRDSLIYTKITKQVSHDTTYTVYHDSTFTRIDTIKVPVPGNVTLKGMYGHPDQVNIGNATSENNFLAWCKKEGVNMINMYARAYLYDESSRTKLAAFVKKAKENYGIIEFSVDVRMTDSRELPGWKAYYAKYNGTISMIDALTEFEPYIRNSSGVYDYPGFFNLIRTMGALTKQYGTKLEHYEGWIGNNYSNPQAAVDSMVKYCDRIFISNYVKISDYNSTSSSLGAWDARMDKRCAAIAVGCKNMGKAKIDIVEIVSLEPVFLFSLYACPATSTNKCNSFFGSAYNKAVQYYDQSTADVLKYTDLIGRTIFYSKYGMQTHP